MKDKKWLIGAWILVMLCLPLSVCAYQLSEADYQTLKNDILAHPAEFQSYVDAGDYAPIAQAYSQAAPTDCWVWKTRQVEDDNYTATSDTGSTWDWTLFVGMQIAEQNGWMRMNVSGGVNPSLDNVRSALAKLFKGANAPLGTHLLAVWRRLALRGESLYVTPGGCSKAQPAKLTFEGNLSPNHINHALTGSNVPLP